MSPTVDDWLNILHGFFPPALAEDWDSVGLQAGDRSWAADRVLVALDPTLEVVREAAERGCGLLITHHPLVFRPLLRLDVSEPVGRVVAEALSSRVAVIACHTNADAARPGVTDALAEALDLRVTGVLRQAHPTERVKLVTFVPSEATAKVLEAMALAGAGEWATAEQQLGMLRERAPKDRGGLTGDILIPLIEGLHAFAEGDYRRVVERIGPLRPRIVEIGGSRAQRDVFHDTLLEACFRAGDAGRAWRLLAERVARRPDAYWLTRKERHGHPAA